MYDVIVVGAGPAGSTAAKILSEKGLHVLVAEKFKMPRYKSCSGVLIKKSMNLIRQYFGEDTPEFTMCTPTDNRGMVFTDDKGKEFLFAQEGLNVWRNSFDHWLAGKAGESGAEIRDATTVISCEEKNDSVAVTLQGEKTYMESARFVLDCEGVVGALKRKILRHTPEYITTFQTFNRGKIDLDPHYFYAYLQPDLSEHDAWFNVKDDYLILGVSVKDASKIKLFYERFIHYMTERHNLQIDQPLRSEKWLMPQIRPGCPIDYGAGRIVFAGEIAGFLNPMGEGISAGMESGFAAACAIVNHFENPERIDKEYRQSVKGLKTYMERQWDFVARMAEPFQEMKL